MYTKILDRFPASGTQVEHFSTAMERRKHRRVRLICRVRLYRNGSVDYIEAQTENISSTGFYCRVEELFSEGERLKCDIYLPAHGLELSRQLCLECEACVLRVEPCASRFGIACRLQGFSVKVQNDPTHRSA